jgi:hypothetical protein
VESPQGIFKQSLKIMGKKTSITTKGTDGQTANNAMAPANGDNALTMEAAVAKRKRASKPATEKNSPPTKVKGSAPKQTAFTQEEIALRAYFIAENRHAHGLPGDAHQDWLEAERQIMAERRVAPASSTASEKRQNPKA